MALSTQVVLEKCCGTKREDVLTRPASEEWPAVTGLAAPHPPRRSRLTPRPAVLTQRPNAVRSAANAPAVTESANQHLARQRAAVEQKEALLAAERQKQQLKVRACEWLVWLLSLTFAGCSSVRTSVYADRRSRSHGRRLPTDVQPTRFSLGPTTIFISSLVSDTVATALHQLGRRCCCLGARSAHCRLAAGSRAVSQTQLEAKQKALEAKEAAKVRAAEEEAARAEAELRVHAEREQQLLREAQELARKVRTRLPELRIARSAQSAQR